MVSPPKPCRLWPYLQININNYKIFIKYILYIEYLKIGVQKSD